MLGAEGGFKPLILGNGEGVGNGNLALMQRVNP